MSVTMVIFFSLQSWPIYKGVMFHVYTSLRVVFLPESLCLDIFFLCQRFRTKHKILEVGPGKRNRPRQVFGNDPLGAVWIGYCRDGSKFCL